MQFNDQSFQASMTAARAAVAEDKRPWRLDVGARWTSFQIEVQQRLRDRAAEFLTYTAETAPGVKIDVLHKNAAWSLAACDAKIAEYRKNGAPVGDELEAEATMRVMGCGYGDDTRRKEVRGRATPARAGRR